MGPGFGLPPRPPSPSNSSSDSEATEQLQQRAYAADVVAGNSNAVEDFSFSSAAAVPFSPSASTNTKPITTKAERNRLRAIHELITTEETYVQNLKNLMRFYATPILAQKILKPSNYQILFPPIIKSIIHLNENLLNSIKHTNTNTIPITNTNTNTNSKSIGSTMFEFIPYLKMYQTYINNHQTCIELLVKLRAENKDLREFLYKCESQFKYQRLESFLILPIQRIPRYELILRDILSNSSASASASASSLTSTAMITNNNASKDARRHALPELEHLRKCLTEIAQINQGINQGIIDFESQLKVHAFEKRFIYDRSQHNGGRRRGRKGSVSFVSPSRKYIYEGTITKVSRNKDSPYLFVLFTDMLIYCDEINLNLKKHKNKHKNKHKHKKNTNKLILHQQMMFDQYFKIQRICLLDIMDDGQHKRKLKKYGKYGNKCFEIRSTVKSFLCYCETHEQREAWVTHIEETLHAWQLQNVSNTNASKNSGSGSGDDRRILETAPMWIPNDFSDECMVLACSKAFRFQFSNLKNVNTSNITNTNNLVDGKNHCNYCGKLVCNACFTKTLPHYLNYMEKTSDEHEYSILDGDMVGDADGDEDSDGDEDGAVDIKEDVTVCDECYRKYGQIPHLMGVRQMEQLRKSMIVVDVDDNGNGDDNGVAASNLNTIVEQRPQPQNNGHVDIFSSLMSSSSASAHPQNGNMFNPNVVALGNGAQAVARHEPPRQQQRNGVRLQTTQQRDESPFARNTGALPKAKSTDLLDFMRDFSVDNVVEVAVAVPVQQSKSKNKNNHNHNHHSNVDTRVINGDAHALQNADVQRYRQQFEENGSQKSGNTTSTTTAIAITTVNEHSHAVADVDGVNGAESNAVAVDFQHENVQTLLALGYSKANILSAYQMLKQNKETRDLFADHGPVFLGAMLDNLSVVRKSNVRNSILSHYSTGT